MDRAVTGRLRPLEAILVLLPLALTVLIAVQTTGLVVRADRVLGQGPGPVAAEVRWHVLVVVPPSAAAPEAALVVDALRNRRYSAAEAGIGLQFSQASAGTDPGPYLRRQARTAALAGLDAVIALQPSPANAADLAAELEGSGIPLVITGTPGPPGSGISSIAALDAAQGERIAAFAADLDLDGPEASPARVAVLCQSCAEWPDPTDTPMLAAFRAGLESRGLIWAGLHVVDGSIAEATRAAREIGSRAGAVDLVYADSLQATLGMTQAVLDLNLVGQMNILGTGTNERIQELLEDRVIAATVIRDPGQIADSILHAAQARLEPGAVAPSEPELRIVLAPSGADREVGP